MCDNINVKYLMLVLTFTDIIILTVFLLVLSSSPTEKVQKPVSIDNTLNKNNSQREESNAGDTEKRIAVEKIVCESQIISKEDYINGKNDSKIASIYSRQIIGKYYLSDDMWFDFEPDGVFNGFLDYNSPNISNGYYQIMVIDENPILNIYNPEITEKISYSLEINNDVIVLYYEAADINIELQDGY